MGVVLSALRTSQTLASQVAKRREEEKGGVATQTSKRKSISREGEQGCSDLLQIPTIQGGGQGGEGVVI